MGNAAKKRTGERLKLVTFQSFDALKDLINKGYLECNEEYIDLRKAGVAYSWVLEKMDGKIEGKMNAKYPIWCWVKCYNNICPPKHKGKPVEGFDVKVSFTKPQEDVFITDFRRYSFLLNNMYIPDSLADKEKFDEKLKKFNITESDLQAYVRPDLFDTHRTVDEYLEICQEIRRSFDKCITTDSDVLQGCVWRITLDEIEKIEFLNDRSYRFGSLYYIRSNGKRINWREDFYKKLC